MGTAEWDLLAEGAGHEEGTRARQPHTIFASSHRIDFFSASQLQGSLLEHRETLDERMTQLAEIARRMEEALSALQSVRNDLLDQEGPAAVDEEPLYATCPLSEYGGWPLKD